MSKIAKRYKKHRKSNPSDGASSRARNNPPLAMDLVEFIAPSFGAFAATRMATRIASTQIAKRWPKMGKHAGALASVGSFLGAWFLGHRVKWLERYHTPIIVGAGIAAAQSLIQIYIPKLGWMVADASPEVKEIAAGNASAQLMTGNPSPAPLADPDFEDMDDGDWYSYNEPRDHGRYAANSSPAPRTSVANEDTTNEYDESMFEMLDDSNEMQAAGIFAP